MRMRLLNISFFVLAGVVLTPGCSAQDLDSPTTGGGGDAGVTQCAIYFVGEGCDPCVHQECCSELAACGAANMNCISCAVSGPMDDPECITIKELATAVRRCSFDRCQSTCWPSPHFPSSGSGSGGGGGNGGSASSGSGG